MPALRASHLEIGDELVERLVMDLDERGLGPPLAPQREHPLVLEERLLILEQRSSVDRREQIRADQGKPRNVRAPPKPIPDPAGRVADDNGDPEIAQRLCSDASHGHRTVLAR